jgi:hypothetical protein
MYTPPNPLHITSYELFKSSFLIGALPLTVPLRILGGGRPWGNQPYGAQLRHQLIQSCRQHSTCTRNIIDVPIVGDSACFVYHALKHKNEVIFEPSDTIEAIAAFKMLRWPSTFTPDAYTQTSLAARE